MIIKTFGNSMLPILRNGDVLYIQKKPFPKIKVNDFVTFKDKDLFITHRVIYKDSKGIFLLTKGDNNPSVDRKVFPGEILGVVKKIKRGKLMLNASDLYLLQSTFYYKEIVGVKRQLASNSIDFVILKGLPLHLYLEKIHPKRIYADCDILIDPNDFIKTEKILKQNGYKKSDDSLSSFHTKIKDKITEVSFYKLIAGFKVVFDIHLESVFLMTQIGSLNFLYPNKLISEFSGKLLSEKKFIKLNKEYFPILSTENLIIYLALHIFHHNFKGYYRFEFLNQIIARTHPNYTTISDNIIKFRLENFVYPAFLLLRKYYSSPLPKIFLTKIKPSKKKLLLTNNIVRKEDIFSEEMRFQSGRRRFAYIYQLSPNSDVKKMLVFLNPQVIYSILWILKRKIQGLIFRNHFLLE